jgi:hypothetical protein
VSWFVLKDGKLEAVTCEREDVFLVAPHPKSWHLWNVPRHSSKLVDPVE